MVIAFCTSCMNRLWQLRETLPRNLEVLRQTPHFLALCNYNSSDELDQYIGESWMAEIAAEKLSYFHTTVPRVFDMSRAKNVSHRLALTRSPDVLFNLDADNFVSTETLRTLERVFARETDVCFHQWSFRSDGSFGRIALRPIAWQRLGGYDEAMAGMGWQDLDLLYRARGLGLKYHHTSEGFPPAIANTTEDKLANTAFRVRDGEGGQQLSRLVAERNERMNVDNMIAAFSRPTTLECAWQTVFPGTMNFCAERVI